MFMYSSTRTFAEAKAHAEVLKNAGFEVNDVIHVRSIKQCGGRANAEKMQIWQVGAKVPAMTDIESEAQIEALLRGFRKIVD